MIWLIYFGAGAAVVRAMQTCVGEGESGIKGARSAALAIVLWPVYLLYAICSDTHE